VEMWRGGCGDVEGWLCTCGGVVVEMWRGDWRTTGLVQLVSVENFGARVEE
jgi:hypothetical protein